MVHVDFLYVIVIDFNVNIIVLTLLLMRVLRSKIEISDISHYAFFAKNTTYGLNDYV